MAWEWRWELFTEALMTNLDDETGWYDERAIGYYDLNWDDDPAANGNGAGCGEGHFDGNGDGDGCGYGYHSNFGDGSGNGYESNDHDGDGPSSHLMEGSIHGVDDMRATDD